MTSKESLSELLETCSLDAETKTMLTRELPSMSEEMAAQHVLVILEMELKLGDLFQKHGENVKRLVAKQENA